MALWRLYYVNPQGGPTTGWIYNTGQFDDSKSLGQGCLTPENSLHPNGVGFLSLADGNQNSLGTTQGLLSFAAGLGENLLQVSIDQTNWLCGGKAQIVNGQVVAITTQTTSAGGVEGGSAPGSTVQCQYGVCGPQQPSGGGTGGSGGAGGAGGAGGSATTGTPAPGTPSQAATFDFGAFIKSPMGVLILILLIVILFLREEGERQSNTVMYVVIGGIIVAVYLYSKSAAPVSAITTTTTPTATSTTTPAAPANPQAGTPSGSLPTGTGCYGGAVPSPTNGSLVGCK